MESGFSLMQMAVAGGTGSIRRDGRFVHPVLTDPTTGGVTASFSMLGDVILAEPRIDRFRRTACHPADDSPDLPEGFQRSEFLQKWLLDVTIDAISE